MRETIEFIEELLGDGKVDRAERLKIIEIATQMEFLCEVKIALEDIGEELDHMNRRLDKTLPEIANQISFLQ